jgi:hypothetical protein
MLNSEQDPVPHNAGLRSGAGVQECDATKLIVVCSLVNKNNSRHKEKYLISIARLKNFKSYEAFCSSRL